MQDLRLIGVHEDGEHLLLAGDDDARYTVPVSDQLRAAVGGGGGATLSARRHQLQGGRQGHLPVEVDTGLRPRDIQAMIRAGATSEEVAERSGWSVEKVNRYGGPITAEREHVARLAQSVPVRGRSAGGAPRSQTLESRVSARLTDRGVSADGARWDAWRHEGGPWTVVVTFAAGGRERQASWHFDPVDRTIEVLDDEARWLSEDEQTPGGLLATSGPPASRRRTRVYDVEAEGGLRATERPATMEIGRGVADRGGADADHREGDDAAEDGRSEGQHAEGTHHHGPVDLVTAMRERSTARSRRRPGSRRGSRKSPTHVPGSEEVPDDALPLEHLSYDPATMALPPAAHAEPGLPEPETAEPEASEPETAEPEVTETEQAQERPAVEATAGGESDEPAGASLRGDDASAPTRPGRRSSRPSVPSWDDVMFGARPRAGR